MGYYGILNRRRAGVVSGTEIYAFSGIHYEVYQPVNSLTVTISWQNDGWFHSTDDPDQPPYPWLYPAPGSASVPGDFEIRVTHVSGSVPTGILNTWLPLGVSRSFSITRTTPGVAVCTINYEIRRIATLVVEGVGNGLVMEAHAQGA